MEIDEATFKQLLSDTIAEIGSARKASELWGVKHTNLLMFLHGILQAKGTPVRAPPAVLYALGARKIKHTYHNWEVRKVKHINYTYEIES
jgi:hypothetical protein